MSNNKLAVKYYRISITLVKFLWLVNAKLQGNSIAAILAEVCVRSHGRGHRSLCTVFRRVVSVRSSEAPRHATARRQLCADAGAVMLSTWGICTRRTGKLYKARYQLYRSQHLQQNMRWKALVEIYTMHSFAPFSWNPSGLKIYENKH